MKKLHLFGMLAVIIALAVLLPSYARDGVRGSRTGRTRSADAKADKCGDDEAAPLDLDLDITFSGYTGITLTDASGTYYHYFGMTFFENKVYPPEYWGVFPLYFFGDNVGVSVLVNNRTEGENAKLLVITECYCLRTDGSNGAQLLSPQTRPICAPAMDSVEVDASFFVQMVPDVESGLDRFLATVARPAHDDHDVIGSININPNNSSNNQFVLTLVRGHKITRADLVPTFEGFSGSARSVHLTPKGNGDQNQLTVDGKPYVIKNGSDYDISADSMTVRLYNDNVNADGLAVGQWWIDIDATGAAISPPPEEVTSGNDDAAVVMVQEAIFCPPEYDSEAADVVDNALGE